ncbi:MAG: carbohydrate ABC transporter permease [Clostridiaceae bacterium]
MKRSFSKKTFDLFNMVFLILVSFSIIFPFMHILSISLSNNNDILAKKVGIFPTGFNIGAYITVLTDYTFLKAFINTVFLTVVTTILSVFVNSLAAYALSRKFYGKKFINYFFLITMYFSGGLIPYYILITQVLHWYNSFAPFIFPALFSFFYIIVMRSQIELIPPSLTESSRIDGAGEFSTIFYIVIPMILPTIAAISMFTAIGSWNQWFPNLLFTDKESLWTLQYFLRQVVLEKSMNYRIMATQAIMNVGSPADINVLSDINYQMASIIVVILPITIIYPFIQKHFVKGILLGSVKE